MLSEDTKKEVLLVLRDGRFAYLLDMDKEDMVNGINLKFFSDMTDDEIVDEYESLYGVHPDDDDELYNRMMAEMSAHKMLTITHEFIIGDTEYMTRQEANRLIIKILAEQVEKYPDIRFSQMMRNCGVIGEDIVEPQNIWRNEFNLEPVELLKRIEKAIKDYGL